MCSDWTEPGTFEVAPGVHRIPLPLPNDGLRTVNVYAVVDESASGPVLVDGGWALEESEAVLAQGLSRIGFGLGDITAFLVTHVHRDHYTQAVAVRRRYGTAVALGEHERLTLEAIQPDAVQPSHPQIDLLEAAGADDLVRAIRARPSRSFSLVDWEMPDTWVVDGAQLSAPGRTLTARHTPGHTRGHVVYHDVSGGLLFSGDHVLPHITPSIGLEAATVRSPLRDFLTSLHLVRQLPDALLLPAHGPVTQSVHERVDELLAHHEERFDATLTAVAAGDSTSYQVARSLGWTRRKRRLDELDLFNQMLAVLETAAHLQVLSERGWVSRDVDDKGVAHWAIAALDNAPGRTTH